MKHETNRRNSRRPGLKRLAPANFGGNWKGTEYLSYREHDLLVQLTRLGPTAASRERGIHGPLTRQQALEVIRQQRK